MKKNRISIITALVLVGLLSITAFSQPHPGMDGKFAKKLNLTDKQKEEIAKIRSDFQKNLINLNADLKVLEIDMKDEWNSSKMDEKKINAITDKIAEIKLKMAKSKTAMFFDIYSKLDDQQKPMFKKFSKMMMEKKRKNMREGREEFREQMGKRRKFNEPLNLGHPVAPPIPDAPQK